MDILTFVDTDLRISILGPGTISDEVFLQTLDSDEGFFSGSLTRICNLIKSYQILPDSLDLPLPFLPNSMQRKSSAMENETKPCRTIPQA